LKASVPIIVIALEKSNQSISLQFPKSFERLWAFSILDKLLSTFNSYHGCHWHRFVKLIHFSIAFFCCYYLCLSSPNIPFTSIFIHTWPPCFPHSVVNVIWASISRHRLQYLWAQPCPYVSHPSPLLLNLFGPCGLNPNQETQSFISELAD